MNHEDAKDTKDLFLYLIGVTDQVKHHALRAIYISLSPIHRFHIWVSYFKGSIKKVTDVKVDERTRRVEGFNESAAPIR